MKDKENKLNEEERIRKEELKILAKYKFKPSGGGEGKETLDFFDMSTEEMEKLLSEATRKAIKNLHDKGIPSIHGDGNEVYKIYPDGRKEVIKGGE